jgi:hypothetical protein
MCCPCFCWHPLETSCWWVELFVYVRCWNYIADKIVCCSCDWLWCLGEWWCDFGHKQGRREGITSSFVWTSLFEMEAHNIIWFSGFLFISMLFNRSVCYSLLSDGCIKFYSLYREKYSLVCPPRPSAYLLANAFHLKQGRNGAQNIVWFHIQEFPCCWLLVCSSNPFCPTSV